MTFKTDAIITFTHQTLLSIITWKMSGIFLIKMLKIYLQKHKK